MLVADNTFIALMDKLKALRVFDVRLSKTRVRGTRLEYQDFVINLGTVSQMETTKGLVLEVNPLLHISSSLWNLTLYLGCICCNG